MSAFKGGYERWVALDDIPGIAGKDEIIVVDHRGILVGRRLPLSKYPDLVKYGHHLSLLPPRRPVPPEPRRLRLMD